MIQRVQGSAGVRLIECVNPLKDKWKVRWDVRVTETGGADYMEADFDHRPSEGEVRDVVVGWVNAQTDGRILSGFVWKGMDVWLSTENQFNYKSAYDLAVQTGGASLPVRFKFGTDERPVYHEFTGLDELGDFYRGCVAYVQDVLEAGWRMKDGMDFSVYGTESEGGADIV